MLCYVCGMLNQAAAAPNAVVGTMEVGYTSALPFVLRLCRNP
jgi:hypothetical protein